MDSELRCHLDMQIEENLRRGLSPEEARSAALGSFGGVEQVKEQCRDVGWARYIEAFWQDLRFGFRILRKNPAFSLIAIATLGLGIGANTAIFSVIYGVLLKPLPYKDGNRLIILHQRAPLAGTEELPFSAKEITDYREQNQTLDAVVEHHSMSFILLGRNEPERVETAVVSANFFEALGVEPLLGRTFVPADEEHGSEAVLILSYKYWQRSHRADPNIVGQVFRMNNRPHTVIGVLPPIPQYPVESDVYMPSSYCPLRASTGFIQNRTSRMMSAFGRVKPGVSVEEAQADLQRVASNLQNEYPDAYPQTSGYRAELGLLHEELTSRARPTFRILLATAVLVLLIACANVANLTLARLLRRERELAIRRALGAGRARLVRQLLAESTLLALAGGAVGLALAAAGLQVLKTFAARFTTRADEISIDGSVLLFTLVISGVTALTFGLVPVLSSRENLPDALKDSSRSTTGPRSHKLRSILVVAQVAVSFVLLTAAGLMLRSLLKLESVDPGFKPDNVLAMRVNLNWSRYNGPDPAREFHRRLLENVSAKPGVVSAAIASSYPLNQLGVALGPFRRDLTIEGRPLTTGEYAHQASLHPSSPAYFETLGIPFQSGRAFTNADDQKAPPIAIINRALADNAWRGEDPIGRRISFNNGTTWLTIVGVVGDSREFGLEREPFGQVYVPLAQRPDGANLLVRTSADPEAFAEVMRSAIHEIDSETAIDRVQTLERVRTDATASPRLTAILLGLFAILALAITASGIAGVMTLTVNQRTHEIGVRLALGATPGRVVAMVVSKGVMLVLIGVLLGSAASLALAQGISTLLFGVGPNDPLTIAGVALVLLMAAGWSCFLPARRVTAIDPITALRSE
jgi:putative ABC transport system permease protein